MINLFLYKFTINNKNIIISISPKCATNTILYMFLKDKNAKAISDKNKKSIHYKSLKYKINNINGDKNAIKLKFIRNPFTRIVSSFIHLMIGKNLNLSFYDFLLVIKDFMILYKENSIKGKYKFIDNKYLEMFYPQKNNIIFDDIIKIEQLHDEIIRINKKYNICLIYHGKKMNNRKTSNTTHLSNYSYKKFKGYKNNIPSNYKLFYDKECFKLVDEIYKEDIIYYNTYL